MPDQLIQYPIQSLPNGLQAKQLGLRFRITPDVFKKGLIEVRCSATILITYEFEASRVISGGSIGSESIDDTGQHVTAVQRTKEAPIITGGRSRYRVGDWIHLNCSTNADDVHLKWYINGNDVSSVLCYFSSTWCETSRSLINSHLINVKIH